MTSLDTSIDLFNDKRNVYENPLVSRYASKEMNYIWSSNNTPSNIPGFSYGGSHNGSYYYVSNNQESWANARAISLANGGNLVCISDSLENDFVSNLIPGQEFWIGFTDEINEGTFVWVDGSSNTYTKWALKFPTDYDKENPLTKK